jgi:site-specific recombinase XerD
MNQPRFNLKNRNEAETLIVMICRVKGQRFVHSTGVKVLTKYWNDKAMRVRATKEYPDHVEINQILENQQAAAIKLLRKHSAERVPLTQLSFKSGIQTILDGKATPNSKVDFSKYFDQFIEERRKSPKYSKSTIQVYETTRRHIIRYVRGKRIQFEDLSVEFLMAFRHYLFDKNYTDNTINKILGTLRTVLNEASEVGINTSTEYKNKKISVPKTDVDNVYLTEADLSKIYHLDLSQKPGQEKGRDLFIVAAYTGLRYSDFSKLKKENIEIIDGKRFFNILIEKTENRVWIPIHGIVEQILRKYDFRLPIAISIQKTNDHLKEICKLAGLNDTFRKRVYKGGRMSEEIYEKWQIVSTHTGRRSFATNAYKSGLPMANIMRITGHKKVETFMKYIKFDNRESALMISSHTFFQTPNSALVSPTTV